MKPIIILSIAITLLLLSTVNAYPSISYEYKMNKTKGDNCLKVIPPEYLEGISLIQFKNVNGVFGRVINKTNSTYNMEYYTGVYYFWFYRRDKSRIVIANYDKFSEDSICSVLWHEIGHNYDNYYLFDKGYIQNNLPQSEDFADSFEEYIRNNKNNLSNIKKDYKIETFINK